jgi:HSP20 family protein
MLVAYAQTEVFTNMTNVPQKHKRRYTMLVKWQPWGSLLNNDTIFDDLIRSAAAPTRHLPFEPKIEVRETEERFLITAELPGLDKKDFSLTVEKNLLVLAGEKKVMSEEKNDGYYRSERTYGSFQRSFRLTDGVDSKKIKAEFKNGVLNIVIPKVEKAKPKQIDVAVN